MLRTHPAYCPSLRRANKQNTFSAPIRTGRIRTLFFAGMSVTQGIIVKLLRVIHSNEKISPPDRGRALSFQELRKRLSAVLAVGQANGNAFT